MTHEPARIALLIGGSSGVGKTIAALEVARLYGAACSQVDDFRLVLQAMATPDQAPALYFFTGATDVWQRSPDELCRRLIEIGELMSSLLEVVVAHHLSTCLPIVLEGDGIIPSFAAQHNFARVAVKEGQARSVFVYEPDEKVIGATMLARGRGFQQYTEREQQTQVRMSYLYGEWLRDEAKRLSLPVIESRPLGTLADRITEVIE